jgi:hypothetical protein
MCRRVSCDRCGKPTYAGCGAHIEQVLGDVPPAERCQCRSEKRSAPARAEQAEAKPRWWKL